MKENMIKLTSYSILSFNLEKKNDNTQSDKDIPNDGMELNFECLQNTDQQNLYCLILNLKTFTTKDIIEIKMAGYFEFDKEVEQEIINYFLQVSAPTVLYPYCRTFISTVTSFDSDQAVLLPIINFANIEEKET